MRFVLYPLVALILLSCTRGVESAAVSLEVQSLLPEEAQIASVAAVESGHHRIRVRRTIQVPDRCRDLAADLSSVGDRLTLRVVAHPAGEACPEEEAYLAYTATIEGLRPGRYNLRVLHGRSSSRPTPEVVLEHPILVLERPVQVEPGRD